MEGFLSLPRSAKGGLAVLLAVALLGWGIVAYSAKRQHEDARSLQSALATLGSMGEREAEAASELESLRQRLAATEGELTTSREAMAASRQEKSDIETRLGELEAELAAARDEPVEPAGEGGALALLEPAGDTEDAGAADAGALQAVAAERDALRERLTKTMTTLSARDATLKQAERALSDLRAEVDEAAADLADQEAADRSLDALTAKLASTQQALEERQASIEAIESELSDFAAAREASMAEASSLTAEIEALQAELTEKEDAIVLAGTELSRLEGDIGDAKASLEALKAEGVVAEAETADLEMAADRQQAVLDDLAALKGELDDTRAELAVQTALLDERRRELAAADDGLQAIESASPSNAAVNQSLPRIAIADLSADNMAVLPIDPMQTPMPVQTKDGVRLTLVHFDLGSAELTPGAMRRAKEAAAWIKQQGIDEKIRLIGATDTIGTRADNLVLAKQRARSLLNVFAEEGIDPDRIELISMGEAGGSEEIADQTAEPLNRCVGVFIGEG